MSGAQRGGGGSRRWLAACGLLALLPLATGCVALAVPVLAAGGVLTQGRSDEAEAPAAVPPSSPVAAAPPAAVPPSSPVAAVPPVAASSPPVAASSPPVAVVRPSVAEVALDPWQPFVAYAIERGQALGGPDPVESALLVPEPPLERPDRLPCTVLAPAVMVDLDPGAAVFAPGPAAQPAAGLAEALARLRASGFVVLWISQAEANRVTAIGDALRASGLDPAGRDPLLLARNAGDRKHVMREEASKSVCLLAIAGDRMSDFDELFDYLRDPTAADGLDAMLGLGWFLTPAPFASVLSEPN